MNWVKIVVVVFVLFIVIRGLIGYGKMMWRIRGFQRNNYTIPIVFEKLTEKHPKKACVIFEDQVWTFEQVSRWKDLQVTEFVME